MTRHDKRMTPAEARVRLEQLPNMLRAERERRGLSMRAAAREMQLSQSTIHRVETDSQWPDLAAFFAIVAWLKVPAGWFLGDESDAEAPVDAYARGWSDCATVVRTALFEAETQPRKAPAFHADKQTNSWGCRCGCGWKEGDLIGECACPDPCLCMPGCGYCDLPTSKVEQ